MIARPAASTGRGVEPSSATIFTGLLRENLFFFLLAAFFGCFLGFLFGLFFRYFFGVFYSVGADLFVVVCEMFSIYGLDRLEEGWKGMEDRRGTYALSRVSRGVHLGVHRGKCRLCSNLVSLVTPLTAGTNRALREAQ